MQLMWIWHADDTKAEGSHKMAQSKLLDSDLWLKALILLFPLLFLYSCAENTEIKWDFTELEMRMNHSKSLI